MQEAPGKARGAYPVIRGVVASPLGALTLTEEDGYLTALDWGGNPGKLTSPLLSEVEAQLTAYFKGRLQRFDLPLAPSTSDFEHGVLEAMFSIPYGETRTYGEIADGLEEGSAQAVGAACGANQIPIIIPCHRILGANSLGGYSGVGGIETKVALLKLEGAAGLLI